MKKPNVLNRSMFNRGGTSAYGRGITSNLVSDEQRQRFNYGGRVGYKDLGLVRPPRFTDNELFNDWGDLVDVEVSEQLPGPYFTKPSEWTEDDGEYGTNQERRLGVMDLEDPRDYQGDVIETAKKIETKDRGDVMTDSDWMELLGPTEEQKKRTKGEAQLGLAAGALDVFSRPTTAKKMQAAVPHLTKLGQTATADQKAREKAILQGKVLSKVYTDRAGAKGAADVETLKAKAKLIKEGDTPRNRYFAGLDSKIGMKKSMEEALGRPIQTIKRDKKDIPIIPEGMMEETIMWDTKDGFMILKDGNLIPVTETQIFGIAT